MQELEQLKKIVLGDGWEADSRQDVANLEKRLQEAVATEKLAEHPVIAEYIAFLMQEIARCKEILSEDGELQKSESQRNVLFEKMWQCREFLNRFKPGQREQVEQNIKDMLDEAFRYD